MTFGGVKHFVKLSGILLEHFCAAARTRQWRRLLIHRSRAAEARASFKLIKAELIMRKAVCVFSLVITLLISTVAQAAEEGDAGPFGPVEASGLHWLHLSSRHGDLPIPGASTQQTSCFVADLDKDGVNDFVLSFRQRAPAVLWYRRTKNGWERNVVEKDFLAVESGGAAFDIDGDGYSDVVFGSDFSGGGDLWWWKNPGPPYDPQKPWKRYTIKKAGAPQYHDQVFGDFKGTGKPQLVYWNQGVKSLYIADIPPHPTEVSDWPATVVYQGHAGENPGMYPTGVSAADIDGDGRMDILAGNIWFKYLGDNRFKAIHIGEVAGRIEAAHLIKGSKYPQIVLSSGDCKGPLMWFECKGDPEKSADWVGHDLLGRPMTRGHSLAIGDIDGDGNLDIFSAEMGQWGGGVIPNAEAWIFFGDGQGHFRKTVFAKDADFHDARLADLNGDGLLDIVNLPYTRDTPRVDVWLQQRRKASAADAQSTTAGGRGPRAADAPVGLEMYSLRAQAAHDMAGALARARQMGFADVEVSRLYDHSAADVRRMLGEAGLTCGSMHASYEQLAAGVDAVARDAKTLGASYVVVSWIPHTGAFSEKDARTAIGKFNSWGEALKKQGLHFCYHPHGFEFAPFGHGTFFDLMAAETTAGTVDFELDIFWAWHGGQDPVALMRKYPDRFPLLHLKDMKKGVRTGVFSGSAPGNDSVVLGQGPLDMPAVLKQAATIGVKESYIEDEADDAGDQIPLSLDYLKSVER